MRQSISRIPTGFISSTAAVLLGMIMFISGLSILPPDPSGNPGGIRGTIAASADVRSSDAVQDVNIQTDAFVKLDGTQTRQVYCNLSVNGVKRVVFDIPLSQDGPNATTITRRANTHNSSPTPSDYELRTAVKHAKLCKLGVVFKPHLEPGGWRAHIGKEWAKNDTATRKWHAAWRAWMVHYAQMAQEEGVEVLIIGVEQRGILLTSLNGKKFNKNNPAEMIKTIRAVRAAAPQVTLSYAAHTNDESEFLPTSFVRELLKKGGFLSLTYYPRWHTENPSAAALEKSMQSDVKKYFKPLHDKYDTNIVFAEVGTRSIALEDAFAKGEEEIAAAKPDENLQKIYFQGLLRALHKISYVDGVMLFRAFNTPEGDRYNDAARESFDDNKSFTWQNKAAEAVVADFFGGYVTGYSSDKVKAYSTRVWNPREGGVMTKPTKVKALLIGKDRISVSKYTMRFRVDGKGSWVTMKNSTVSGAHKEGSIDPTKWSDGSRHYVIIESRNADGRLIAKTIRMVTAG